MNKTIFTLLFVALSVSASFAQMRVTSQEGSGTARPDRAVIFDTNQVSPIVFKVDGVLAGFTGMPGVGLGITVRSNTNVSFGFGALGNPLTGNNNTAVGFQALQVRTTGIFNTAVGSGALFNNTTGNRNVAIGASALRHTASGDHNVAIGYSALNNNRTGNLNVAIGRGADVSGDNFIRATAIGALARATASHQVRIGCHLVNKIGGQVDWHTFSDERAKRTVRTEVPGLEFINRLNPVIYTVNLDIVDELMGIDRMQAFALDSELSGEEICFEQAQFHKELFEQERIARENRQNQLQTGFLAQEVRAAAESIGYDFSGVVVDELGIYALRYAAFVVPLVRAVQELSQINEQQQAQIEALNTRIQQLERGSIIGIPTPPPVQTMNAPAPAPSSDWNPFDDAASSGTAVLHQNVPNPFRQETKIKFYLPQTVTTAFLIFYDLQGRQLHQVTLTQRGEGMEIISGSQFAPGIYLYALIVDGQEAGVRRMIITE